MVFRNPWQPNCHPLDSRHAFVPNPAEDADLVTLQDAHNVRIRRPALADANVPNPHTPAKQVIEGDPPQTTMGERHGYTSPGWPDETL